MNRLERKVALVSGGSRGIGAGIARRLAAEGARVVIGDVLDTDGAALVRELGAASRFVHLDVTSAADWEAAIGETERAFGKLDILVNNAGIIMFKGIDDLTEADMRKIIDVNLLGTMLGTKLAIPALERAGGGAIVNISSADGISGANSLSAYCASKFGVRGFTKACALELGPRNIRVNSVHPGGIMTQMANPQGLSKEEYDKGYRIYPAQRSGDPADIAAAVAYLASDDGAYCIGTELSVDGGLNAGHYYMGLPGSPNID